MTTLHKPLAIKLGSARKLTKTDYQGDILEVENPVLARKL